MICRILGGGLFMGMMEGVVDLGEKMAKMVEKLS